MINWIFRIAMAFCSTAWMIIVFIIKEHISWICGSRWITTAVMIVTELLCSLLILKLTRLLDKDEMLSCSELVVADNEYLPVYLGYFFAALSVGDWYTFLFIYGIVFVMALLMNVYFNPTFIVFGFHYYHATTATRTHIFLISNRKVRNPREAVFTELRRINDFTYVTHEGD